jgi:hypothetical protein
MAISRPFLLALLGAALLGATVFAVTNARKSDDDGPAPVAKQAADQAAPAPTPAPAQASGKLDAKTALTSILSPGKPVDSGRFSIRYDTKELRGGREHDYGTIAGTFVSKGANALPDFDVSVRTHNEVAAGRGERDRHERAVIAGGQPFVGSSGQLYKLPASSLEGVGAVRRALAGTAAAKLPQFDLSRWLGNVKVVGVEKVDGVDATHVSGDVMAGKAAADILQLARVEAQNSGSTPDLPAGVQRTAKRAVKKAEFDAWVGADRVVRRMTLAAEFDAPKAIREPGDSARWTADFDIRLSDVNGIKAVEAPSNVAAQSAAKGMGAKDAKSAGNSLSVAALAVDAPGGVVGGTYSFLRLNRVGDSTQVAKKVLRAVEQRNEVVIFFRNPKGLDDKATAESVKYLESHTKKLAVYTDDVEHARSYGELLQNVGVTQAPAIVFVNRRGKASLVEGYVDGPSLRQVVADAR